MDVKELLAKQAKDFPHKPAIIFKEKKVTFCEMRDISFKLANYLLSRGIKKQDRIALFLPNTLEAVFAEVGIFSLGAILVPLDFMLTEEEIINFINHSKAKILITEVKKEVDLAAIKNNCPGLKEVIVCKARSESFLFWEDIIEKNNPKRPRGHCREDNLSSIFYTSGSTGQPKGVELTYRNLDNPPKTISHFLEVYRDDIFLCGGVPFSHIGGLNYILLMLRFGCTLILMERFQPLEFLRNIETYKVTIFCIVPAMYVAILSLKEYDKFDLSSLRYAVVFGAPSSPALLKRFHKVCPKAKVLNGWGMTETSAPNTFSPPDENKLSSIGSFGFNMEAKIVNDEGIALGKEEQGELWVKGEGIMRGYYRNPHLTRQVLTSDGWLKTGDIAKFDNQGLYYIVGRKKDMIKVGGEIVFSGEVEEKINQHPKIKETAVVGVPDKLRGEVPKAFIILKENEILQEGSLKEFLKEHLAHFKIPHYFEFVERLPKTRSGKIDKTKLT